MTGFDDVTPPVFITARELLSQFGAAGVTVGTLVRHVLSCTPVNGRQRRTGWRPLSLLTVGQVMRQEVVCEPTSDEPSAPGLSIAAAYVLEHAGRAHLFARRAAAEDLMVDERQVEEIYKATTAFLKPYAQLRVEALLRRSLTSAGFHVPPVSVLLSELDELHRPRLALPLAAAHEQVPTDLRARGLRVWRTDFAEDDGRHRIAQGAAFLGDADGRVAAYATMSLVDVPPGRTPAEWVQYLGAQGPKGLELASGLKQRADRDLTFDPFQEGPLLHLTYWEVRHDRRGASLGAQLLAQALPLFVGDDRPATLALCLSPAQYMMPLPFGCAELSLEILEAQERLQNHLEEVRLQDNVDSLRESCLLYLMPDPRACGTDFEQLDLMAEAATVRY